MIKSLNVYLMFGMVRGFCLHACLLCTQVVFSSRAARNVHHCSGRDQRYPCTLIGKEWLCQHSLLVDCQAQSAAEVQQLRHQLPAKVTPRAVCKGKRAPIPTLTLYYD